MYILGLWNLPQNRIIILWPTSTSPHLSQLSALETTVLLSVSTHFQVTQLAECPPGLFMLARIWRKRNTCPLLMRIQTCTFTVEICMVVSQEDANQSTSRLTTALLGIYLKDTSSHHRDTYTHIHCFSIQNKQKLETSQMSVNR